MNLLKNKNIMVVVGLLFVVALMVFGKSILGGRGTEESSERVAGESVDNKQKAVVYKSPSCGCCVGYVSYLKKQGFEVEVVETNNISQVKQEHNIPHDKQSCHTTVIGDYFIEGHVPIEVVEKLLAEKPEIDGIALPDMPAGSPGMPGAKRGDFEIFSLVDGEASEFVKL